MLCLVKTEAGRKAQERKGVGIPPSEEVHGKRWLINLCRPVLPGLLSSFRPIIWFLFPYLTCPGTLPWGVHAPLSQEGSVSEGFWKEQESVWSGVIP